MKIILPLLLLLLLLAGCAQKVQTEDATEPATGETELQTALEAVSNGAEQEIFLPLDDELSGSSSIQADLPPQITVPTTAAQTTATAKEDMTKSSTTTTTNPASEQKTASTTTTKPAAEQKTASTTTTKPAAEQKTTATTTGISNGTSRMTDAPATTASGTPAITSAPTTTSGATLPTADAEKGRFELPAIPLT